MPSSSCKSHRQPVVPDVSVCSSSEILHADVLRTPRQACVCGCGLASSFAISVTHPKTVCARPPRPAHRVHVQQHGRLRTHQGRDHLAARSRGRREPTAVSPSTTTSLRRLSIAANCASSPNLRFSPTADASAASSSITRDCWPSCRPSSGFAHIAGGDTFTTTRRKSRTFPPAAIDPCPRVIASACSSSNTSNQSARR